MSFCYNEINEFYPTPKALLEKMTEGLNWWTVHTVLEPSAGKGDIVEYLLEKEASRRNYSFDIDCIEINESLKNTLTGKKYRIVHDNFLTFQTMKQYDLIIMNPPFSQGAAHLMHAINLQKYGGSIICILSAETLRNPYSKERKALCNTLEELNAEISYYSDEFTSSERQTAVEIALIKITIPKKTLDSEIFKKLETKAYSDKLNIEYTELAPGDFIEAIIRQYEIELEAGVTLIREYQAMQPKIMNAIGKDFAMPMLQLQCSGNNASVNSYVKLVRNKYWSALFANPKFTGNMPSEQQAQYMQRVKQLEDYDFSSYNIAQIQKEMQSNLVKGIEDCIISLFDELSAQYSWYDTSKNIHYFNGWATNKAWMINKKVILPYINAWGRYDGKYNPTGYELIKKLSDIEKALNYLDGGRLSDEISISAIMESAKLEGTTKNVRCKFFDITFFKKGTCHIVFRDDELLKKLNIFGSQQKGWLPQDYGRKAYNEMTQAEKTVIDSFEGEIEYNKTLDKADFYIYNPENNMLKLA